MSERRDFVVLASKPGANVAELCRRFGIARKTGYKWLARYQAEGEAGLGDRSRRPRSLRAPTSAAMEQAVLEVRRAHRAWGGRKIAARLKRLGYAAAGVPAPSTITNILHRHQLIHPDESAKRGPLRRFERPNPNDLWQMDFKGEFRTQDQRYCYPLTVTDDHSRFSIALQACRDQKRLTVQAELTAIFQRYGLPVAMLMDNGPPWGSPRLAGHYSKLTVWLLRLGVDAIHGRPYHPQTQGKEERFHRTLKVELLQDRQFADWRHTQACFDPWRQVYNHERPHEALAMAVPADRYQPSTRTMPSSLPPIEYNAGDQVRKVNAAGQIWFQHRRFKVGEAFAGEPVAVRPTREDGVFQVYFSSFKVSEVDLRTVRRG